MESPPYPNRVMENLLTTVENKSVRRCYEPYEQIYMKYQISSIKELNEESSCGVYLGKDPTKVIQGKTTKAGKPIITCAIGTSCIIVFVILEKV
jgi:hypothetical protein